MDLNKHLDFLNPAETTDAIHVIGVGAIGSRVVEQLVRLGFKNIYIYDFDKVDTHNITNQLYTYEQVGEYKVKAMLELMSPINKNAIRKVYNKGYIKQPLSGYVFLCVDSIELRHKIATDNIMNKNIKAMFDCRMRLTDAQAFAAKWSDDYQVKAFIGSMSFTDEEARENTPVSACGTSLSVAPTVLTIVSLQVANFINLIKKDEVSGVILADPFNGHLQIF